MFGDGQKISGKKKKQYGDSSVPLSTCTVVVIK
jgi:hypothetical protein